MTTVSWILAVVLMLHKGRPLVPQHYRSRSIAAGMIAITNLTVCFLYPRHHKVTCAFGYPYMQDRAWKDRSVSVFDLENLEEEGKLRGEEMPWANDQ